MRGAVSRFPETFQTVPTPTLLAAYRAGPDRLRAALDGLDAGLLQRRPRPGVWSILEVTAHMADSELIGGARIRLVMAQPGSAFFGYDQDVWARYFRYVEFDPGRLAAVLDLFTALRRTTLAILEEAQDADWRSTGIHPEHGTVTLRNLLELYADHSERHIAQIVARRGLLGQPLDLPPLLPERLY